MKMQDFSKFSLTKSYYNKNGVVNTCKNISAFNKKKTETFVSNSFQNSIVLEKQLTHATSN